MADGHRATRGFAHSPALIVCAKTAEYRSRAESLPALHDKVIEIGSSYGCTCEILARGAGSVVGVEIEESLVAESRRRFPTLDFRCADGTNLLSLANALGVPVPEDGVPPREPGHGYTLAFIDIAGTATAGLALAAVSCVERLLCACRRGRGVRLIVVKNLSLARLQQQMFRGSEAIEAARSVSSALPIKGMISVTAEDNGASRDTNKRRVLRQWRGPIAQTGNRHGATTSHNNMIHLEPVSHCSTAKVPAAPQTGPTNYGGPLAIRRWLSATMHALDTRFPLQSGGGSVQVGEGVSGVGSVGPLAQFNYSVWRTDCAAAFAGHRHAPSLARHRAEVCLPAWACSSLLRPSLLAMDEPDKQSSSRVRPVPILALTPPQGHFTQPATSATDDERAASSRAPSISTQTTSATQQQDDPICPQLDGRNLRRARPGEMRQLVPADFERASRWLIAPPFPLKLPGGSASALSVPAMPQQSSGTSSDKVEGYHIGSDTSPLRCVIAEELFCDVGASGHDRIDSTCAKTNMVWLELGIGIYMQCEVHELKRMLGATPIPGLLSWS